MTPNRIAMFAATVAVAAGAIGFARMVDAQQPRYVMVDELVADPSYDHDLKVHGYIVPGTIHYSCTRTSFELEWQGKRVTVTGPVLLSSCMRDRSEVIVRSNDHFLRVSESGEISFGDIAIGSRSVVPQ